MQLTAVAERAARWLAAERSLAAVLVPGRPGGLAAAVLEGGPDVAAALARIVGRAASRRPGPTLAPPIPPRSSLPCWRTLQPIGRASAGRPERPRARAVLRMLDVGRSNQQIARALGVTVNTVKWYLKNIFASSTSPTARRRRPWRDEAGCGVTGSARRIAGGPTPVARQRDA